MKYAVTTLIMLLWATSVVASGVALKDIYPALSFTMPVALVQHPVEDDRWYLVEQPGRIQEINAGRKDLFADLSPRVKSGGEKGLLGFAFHPNYIENGQLFFSYTAEIDGVLHSIVSRWHSQNGKPLPQSEQVLLKIKQPYGNHNGGQIAFGPDGYLYVGLGDGGWAGDPAGHAQNLTTLLGSLLRIDVNNGAPYAIPADNPFAAGGGRSEIFAYGLRNPWRWSFDIRSGNLWLADVGQDRYEEINLIQKGGNYGWNVREAGHCYDARVCDSQPYIDPVYEYGRAEGKSVTGGYIYWGKSMPELQGAYLFGDFVSGRIWSMQTMAPHRVTELLKAGHNISSFAQGRNGEVYVLSYAQGKVYQLHPKD